MLSKRASPKIKVARHTFYTAEPLGFMGGFAGWMNGRVADLEAKLDAGGGKRPYGILFGGGDGKLSPCWIEVFEAKP